LLPLLPLLLLLPLQLPLLWQINRFESPFGQPTLDLPLTVVCIPLTSKLPSASLLYTTSSLNAAYFDERGM
jgi:hypothetical protein